eukprot:CAMPEP_0171983732 /NCGR_PEP_ID=MMETSP0993-20121228/273459_1 /TAXON_ID=483369 /ORGANISM="non described non described, Strain CCMP2098" /LENGTH=482 /DNA_ID=CAMNT_0012636521 /DNA_START=117 /DNA_END=1566 /DNA_ORIENTATION=+
MGCLVPLPNTQRLVLSGAALSADSLGDEKSVTTLLMRAGGEGSPFITLCSLSPADTRQWSLGGLTMDGGLRSPDGTVSSSLSVSFRVQGPGTVHLTGHLVDLAGISSPVPNGSVAATPPVAKASMASGGAVCAATKQATSTKKKRVRPQGEEAEEAEAAAQPVVAPEVQKGGEERKRQKKAQKDDSSVAAVAVVEPERAEDSSSKGDDTADDADSSSPDGEQVKRKLTKRQRKAAAKLAAVNGANSAMGLTGGGAAAQPVVAPEVQKGGEERKRQKKTLKDVSSVAAVAVVEPERAEDSSSKGGDDTADGADSSPDGEQAKRKLTKRQRKAAAKLAAVNGANSAMGLDGGRNGTGEKMNCAGIGIPIDKPKTRHLGGGLTIKDTVLGSGPVPSLGRKVKILYEGFLPDGSVFDSKQSTRSPLTFRLGLREVVRGMDKGLEGMHVGGCREIKIPSAMGYGEKKVGPIPPNTDLLFKIELIGLA